MLVHRQLLLVGVAKNGKDLVDGTAEVEEGNFWYFGVGFEESGVGVIV